jgi:hypothetical protein
MYIESEKLTFTEPLQRWWYYFGIVICTYKVTHLDQESLFAINFTQYMHFPGRLEHT